MNDVELMNIQMDHVQRHHCDGSLLESIKGILLELKIILSDSANRQLDHLIARIPELECHLVKVLLEAQAEHQAIITNQMEDN